VLLLSQITRPQSGREDLGWMFCPYSGYMLEFDPVRGVATCPQSGYTKKLEGAFAGLRATLAAGMRGLQQRLPHGKASCVCLLRFISSQRCPCCCCWLLHNHRV
jgi:hypothetical protein